MSLRIATILIVSLAASVGLGGCKVYKEPYLSASTAADSGISGSSGNAGAQGGSPAAAGSGGAAGSTSMGDAGSSDAGIVTAPGGAECGGGLCWWSEKREDCESAGVPGPSGRPAASGDGTSNVPELYFGFTRIWIGETTLKGMASDTAWQSFGFDLDGRCTNSSTCPSMQNVQSCKASTAMLPFDGELCRDNTFASLQPVAAAVPEIGKRFGISEDLFNCNLWRGSYNMVWKISGYNGSPNDSDVRVDFYVSPGLERLPPWDCPLDHYSEMYPQWRTVNPWLIDPAYLSGPITTPGSLPNSMIADPHAYVRGGYLVAYAPDGALMRLAGDGTKFRGFALTVQKGIWTGKLALTQSGTWRISDGLAAGRTKSEDLIASFRQIGLCEGIGLDAFYQDVTDYIHQNADVLADGTVDPNRPCDSMSLGIGFEAAQLTPGTAMAATAIVECCEPGVAIQDCNPKCGDGRKNGKEKCDTAATEGPDACPTSCKPIEPCTPTKLMGTGCDAECVAQPITQVGAQDGCCPKGADSTSDSDCKPVCGNNVLESGETCDPVSSCPSCMAADKCLMVTSTGAADSCNLSCTYAVKSGCMNGDGCCPNGCNSSNDNDCSSTCNNGTVDKPKETCETGGANACPTSCDDGDPCTTDYITGRASTCNVTCTHVRITALKSGDKCCPTGANANNDSDCVIKCGNGTREGSEECDDGNQVAGDGCKPDCTKESSMDQCLAKLPMNDKPECAACNCTKCQAQTLACYAASSASAVKACADVVKCGLDKGCSGQDCYCGSADFASCALGLGNGPCRPEIETATGSSAVGDILVRRDDTSYPVGRANQLAECGRTNCAAECGIKTQ